MSKPRTLQQAIQYFGNPDNCLNFMVERRWREGVTCPTCGSKDVRFIPTRRLWECKTKHPKRQFSAKVGTIMEDSAIPLDKWLITMWMVANCKNGVSSYEIGRALGITQKSAWFMLHRIRLAMQSRSTVLMGGRGHEVEVDETFIGGAARFMHRDKHRRRITETGTKDKTAVVGVLDRKTGQIRAAVVGNRRKHGLQTHIMAHVKAGSAIYTDALLSYEGLKHRGFEHEVVDPMPKDTLTVGCTLTGLKTFGVCSSADSRAHTSALNLSISSGIWMSKCSATTTGLSLTMDCDSSTSPLTSSESV